MHTVRICDEIWINYCYQRYCEWNILCFVCLFVRKYARAYVLSHRCTNDVVFFMSFRYIKKRLINSIANMTCTHIVLRNELFSFCFALTDKKIRKNILSLIWNSVDRNVIFFSRKLLFESSCKINRETIALHSRDVFFRIILFRGEGDVSI
jgi:hypothetical protein